MHLAKGLGDCPSSGHCLGILAGLNGSEIKEAVDKLGSQLTTAGIKVAAVTTVSMRKESSRQQSRGLSSQCWRVQVLTQVLSEVAFVPGLIVDLHEEIGNTSEVSSIRGTEREIQTMLVTSVT